MVAEQRGATSHRLPQMRTLPLLLLAALTSTASADDESPNLFYAQLLGTGGAYGVGYERTVAPRLAIGLVGSYAVIREQRIATVSPYLHATALRRGHNALFGELGAVATYSALLPTMDWHGTSTTGFGGVASIGWEHANRHVVVRIAVSLLAGAGQAAPWGGVAVGARP
jgi:hypothetical protein